MQKLNTAEEFLEDNSEVENLLLKEDVFMGVEELLQQEPEFYIYLLEKQVQLQEQDFPFNKHTGQRYIYFPELAIAEASFYLDQYSNEIIQIHSEQVRNQKDFIDRNPSNKYFKINTNACARSPEIKELVEGLPFIHGSGTGGMFTLEDIIHDRKNLAQWRHTKPAEQFSIVMIDGNPQLLFGNQNALKQAYIKTLEKEYIIMLRKAIFKTVIEKTHKYVQKLNIPNTIKENITLEGSLSEEEIEILKEGIERKINGQIFSFLHRNENKQGQMLLDYLLILDDSMLKEKQTRQWIIKMAGPDFFKNNREYLDLYRQFQENLNSVQNTDSLQKTVLADYYKKFCTTRQNPANMPEISSAASAQVSFNKLTLNQEPQNSRLLTKEKNLDASESPSSRKKDFPKEQAL